MNKAKVVGSILIGLGVFVILDLIATKFFDWVSLVEESGLDSANPLFLSTLFIVPLMLGGYLVGKE